ncbi:ATP12 family protein [Aliiroseovarius sp. F47248L]|uniref:ATP12 family chaperone protein n=1 Tax=Aliiroseovarius sp. F47248L TaxID=2926420 RepID=UPI001FF45A04|nr:ATP12 family protein [Aliiroseovarius sp. F47248L]MCK0137511.1 ATPase [Aliiroseovarius sp. F47248L]
MSDWAAKRFWKQAQVVETEGGYSVELDGRSIKTPAKKLLRVPTLTLAKAIAEEWDAQVDKVDPGTMPVTRTANSALDKVAHQFDDVADMLAAYGDSDLLCYRATHPEELVARQSDLWDPMLEWAAKDLGARLQPVAGIVHQPQDGVALSRLSVQVHALSEFELAGFHDLVAISGSLVLALAVTSERISVEQAWELSRLDETWQEEQWGVDEEASELAEKKRIDIVNAAWFFHACRRET